MEVSLTSRTPPAGPSPTYTIFRDIHGIPQFSPKRGSQALKDALIYSFPSLSTELELMQAALRKFFDGERNNSFICELPENNLQTSLASSKQPEIVDFKASLRSWKIKSGRERKGGRSRASSIASTRGSSRASSRASRPDTPVNGREVEVGVVGGVGTMSTWMLASGEELGRRKRAPYDAVKRRKVAENRGMACERHRGMKVACDPATCSENKLHGKVGNGVGKAGMNSRIPQNPAEASDETSQPEQEPQNSFQLLPVASNPASDIANHSTVPQWREISLSLPTKSPWKSYNTSIISTPSLQSPSSECLPQAPGPCNGELDHSSTEPESHPYIEHAPPHVHTDSWSAIADPFMGWEERSGSWNLEDYDWVLEHVETL